MSIRVEVQPLNASSKLDFYELRDKLVQSGKRFDSTNLHLVPYKQLHLCCIGNAESAGCSRNLIANEKSRRRERFLSMEPDEFTTCTNFLKIEQMYEDVIYAINHRSAPTWNDLNDRQKVWMKLVCIINHLDSPTYRLGEALLYLRRCSVNTTESLPADVAMSFSGKIKGIITMYPKVEDEAIRAKLTDVAESLIAFLPDEERLVIEKEMLQDYSCTSDCFRLLV
jgi:hypothetical protein